jgi:hypothetical protein
VGTEPRFYLRPEGVAIELRTPPRLASWNAAGHPDQVRLTVSLDHAEKLLAPTLTQLTGSVALRLDVGLPDHILMLDAHDLDNYALPLAHRLTTTQTHPRDGRTTPRLLSRSGLAHASMNPR